MLHWGICSQLPSEFLYFTLHQMLALVRNIQHTRTLSVSRTCHACHKAKNRLANYLPDRISHVSAYEDSFGYSFITSKWLACVGMLWEYSVSCSQLSVLWFLSLFSLSLSLFLSLSVLIVWWLMWPDSSTKRWTFVYDLHAKWCWTLLRDHRLEHNLLLLLLLVMYL